MICQVYFDFLDACSAEKLNCNTGQSKFAFFPKILLGAAAAKWRAALDEDAGAHTSNAAFLRVVRVWVAKYVDSTACNDMKEYLLQAKKVYTMTVTQTAERLKVLVMYMRLLPGAPNDGNDDVYNDTDLKTALHRLMLPAWRTALMKACRGRSFLNDDDYTFANMVEFYKVMESEERGRRARETRTGRGGRGYGRSARGGRGSGRSSGRGGRYTSDRQVSRRRSYEDGDYGPPAQRPRYAGSYNGGYTAGGYQGNRAPFGRGGSPARGSSGRGRGRSSGRGRSAGRGRSESHAIATAPATETDDTVEEAPQEEEEHYHQEAYEPRQEHWVDEHFGHYDVDYGYDDGYHAYDGYDY